MQLRRVIIRIGLPLVLLLTGGWLTVHAAQTAPPWPPDDADQALSTLSQILSADEFQYQDPDDLSPWQQFLERIADFLDRLLPYSAGVSTGVNRLLGLLAALVMALIIFYVLSSLFREIVFEQNLILDETEQEVLTAQKALERAQTLSAEGDYRTAVRYLYLSTLLLLEEHGVLRYDRTRTNREVLRSVRDTPELAVILRDVIDVFDRSWYGYQPIDEITYQQYEDAVYRLQRIRPR